MYDVSPTVREAWKGVLSWISREAGIDLDIITYPSPQPLEKLWSRPDLGCAFMCGWPFALASPQPRPIAAVVPSPERYGCSAVYFTDFVVRADSPHRTLADTFGKVIGWTVDHSHSGFNAVRYHLLGYRSNRQRRLYSSASGPLISPGRVVDAVIEGEVTVGPLDSYYHDLLRRHLPDVAARLRTVEMTEAAPIPPLVSAPTIDETSLHALREAFAAAHQASELKADLTALLVQKFVVPGADDYAVLVERAQTAEREGFDFRP